LNGNAIVKIKNPDHPITNFYMTLDFTNIDPTIVPITLKCNLSLYSQSEANYIYVTNSKLSSVLVIFASVFECFIIVILNKRFFITNFIQKISFVQYSIIYASS
jgi:hypothetical protein